MADTIKTTKTLVLVEGYADGSENTLFIDNPADTITANAITELADFNVANNIQDGFVGYKYKKIRTNTHTEYDISN